jgi:hypothetical protein
VAALSLVLQEGGEASPIEGDPEVFRFWPETRHNVLVEFRLLAPQVGHGIVVDQLLLILVGQLAAVLQRVLPDLALMATRSTLTL